MVELIKSVQQAFTDAGSDNVSFRINLTEAESESDLTSSDHVIHITDLSPTNRPDARGVVNEIGGKVAWINQDLFSGNVGGARLSNLMGILFRDGPIDRLSRTIMHEMGHHMGLENYNAFGNVMQVGFRGRNLNTEQIQGIQRAYPRGVNRGQNRGVFMPNAHPPTIRPTIR